MLRNPKVNVLLAVRNGAQTIAVALASILSQTFKNFEVIVIDDGSTDGTAQEVTIFQDDRVILKAIPHSGLTKALNQGLRMVRGEYIARMDADDIAIAERFEKQVRFLDEHPKVGVLGTAYDVLLESGERQKPRVPLLRTDEEIRKALPKFNPFFHGSVMMRREALEKVGGYDENFLLAQDYDLWFRIAKHYQLANLDEALMLRREGRGTVEKEARQNWFGICARAKAIRDGNSPWWGIFYLFRPFFVIITPIWLKIFVRCILPVNH